MLFSMCTSTDFQSIIDRYGRMAHEKRFISGNGERNCFIRIENEIDRSLQLSPAQNDILDMISSIRVQQSRYGCATLYDRHWIATANTSRQQQNNVGEWTSTASIDNDSFIFSVAQFNALAEGLSAGSNIKTPFASDDDDAIGGYGGFTSVPKPDITLDFQQRKWRILEAILAKIDSKMFDIIAIQEMDRFYGFFEPLLNLFGYDGLFIPKCYSPGIRFGWYSDGCCLFWKRDQFRMISHSSYQYSAGGSQVLLIVCMKHIATQKPLIFATTHLKSKSSRSNEEIRQKQVLELLEHLDDVESKFEASLGLPIETGIPIVVLGDFNADPPSHNSLPISSIRSFLQHQTKSISQMYYKSAYDIDYPDPSFFTTWKIRGGDACRRIIDYIFFRGHHIHCVATLQVPQTEEIESTKLPGLRYPSDHMLIGAQFQVNFTKSK
jgi:mRNA deadenylase 3'-5' endonuclease subunit Ccr4